MTKKSNGQETALDIGVTDEGVVVLQLSSLVREIRFAPEQATAVGLGLIQWATRADSLRRANAPMKARVQ